MSEFCRKYGSATKMAGIDTVGTKVPAVISGANAPLICRKEQYSPS